jgi:hypothetical protein
LVNLGEGVDAVRRLLVVSIIFGLALAPAGCVTPVIPLPPPKPGDLTLDITDPAKNLVTIAGKAAAYYKGAYIFILNLTTGHGVIVPASVDDGSFESDPFEAKDGNRIDLWAKHAPDDEEGSDVLRLVLTSGTLKEAGY